MGQNESTPGLTSHVTPPRQGGNAAAASQKAVPPQKQGVSAAPVVPTVLRGNRRGGSGLDELDSLLKQTRELALDADLNTVVFPLVERLSLLSQKKGNKKTDVSLGLSFPEDKAREFSRLLALYLAKRLILASGMDETALRTELSSKTGKAKNTLDDTLQARIGLKEGGRLYTALEGGFSVQKNNQGPWIGTALNLKVPDLYAYLVNKINDDTSNALSGTPVGGGSGGDTKTEQDAAAAREAAAKAARDAKIAEDAAADSARLAAAKKSQDELAAAAARQAAEDADASQRASNKAAADARAQAAEDAKRVANAQNAADSAGASAANAAAAAALAKEEGDKYRTGKEKANPTPEQLQVAMQLLQQQVSDLTRKNSDELAAKETAARLAQEKETALTKARDALQNKINDLERALKQAAVDNQKAVGAVRAEYEQAKNDAKGAQEELTQLRLQKADNIKEKAALTASLKTSEEKKTAALAALRKKTEELATGKGGASAQAVGELSKQFEDQAAESNTLRQALEDLKRQSAADEQALTAADARLTQVTNAAQQCQIDLSLLRESGQAIPSSTETAGLRASLAELQAQLAACRASKSAVGATPAAAYVAPAIMKPAGPAVAKPRRPSRFQRSIPGDPLSKYQCNASDAVYESDTKRGSYFQVVQTKSGNTSRVSCVLPAGVVPKPSPATVKRVDDAKLLGFSGVTLDTDKTTVQALIREQKKALRMLAKDLNPDWTRREIAELDTLQLVRLFTADQVAGSARKTVAALSAVATRAA